MNHKNFTRGGFCPGVLSWRYLSLWFCRGYMTGGFLSWNQNWLGLLNCIPKAWKNKIAANPEQLYSAPGNLYTKHIPFITFKTADQILLKSLVRPVTAQRSLESSPQLTNADWKKICMLPRLTTMESSLHFF